MDADDTLSPLVNASADAIQSLVRAGGGGAASKRRAFGFALAFPFPLPLDFGAA